MIRFCQKCQKETLQIITRAHCSGCNKSYAVKAFANGLSLLPEDLKTAVFYFIKQTGNMTDTAKVLGIKKPTLKSRIAEASYKLKHNEQLNIFDAGNSILSCKDSCLGLYKLQNVQCQKCEFVEEMKQYADVYMHLSASELRLIRALLESFGNLTNMARDSGTSKHLVIKQIDALTGKIACINAAITGNRLM